MNKKFGKMLAEDIKRTGTITDDEIILKGIKDKVKIPFIKNTKEKKKKQSPLELNRKKK